MLYGACDAYWYRQVVLGDGYFDLELDVNLHSKASMIKHVPISVLCSQKPTNNVSDEE